MPGAVKIVSEDTNGNPVTDSAGNPAGRVTAEITGATYTEAALSTYDAEIYNVNGDVTTDGSIISGLSDYTKWTFQVSGIGATGATLAIQVSLDGTNFDYLGLKQIGVSGNPVSTVVADGVYVVSHTAGSANVWYGEIGFKSLQVDRIAAGTGVGDLVVRALGRL